MNPEEYHAVFYDNIFYIGWVLLVDHEGREVRMKFIREIFLLKYVWPGVATTAETGKWYKVLMGGSLHFISSQVLSIKLPGQSLQRLVQMRW